MITHNTTQTKYFLSCPWYHRNTNCNSYDNTRDIQLDTAALSALQPALIRPFSNKYMVRDWRSSAFIHFIISNQSPTMRVHFIQLETKPRSYLIFYIQFRGRVSSNGIHDVSDASLFHKIIVSEYTRWQRKHHREYIGHDIPVAMGMPN